MYIVINDKSQGSTQFATEIIFKIGEHFGEVTDKIVDLVIRLTLLSSKMQNLPEKCNYNNLCITDRQRPFNGL